MHIIPAHSSTEITFCAQNIAFVLWPTAFADCAWMFFVKPGALGREFPPFAVNHEPYSQ